MRRLLATVAGVVLLSASSLVMAAPAYGWVEAIYWGTPLTQVPVGTTGSVGGVTLYNWNMMAPFQIVTVTSVAISGPDGADFAVVNDHCTGVPLGDMSGYTGYCGVGVAFTPSRLGIETATITFEYTSNVSGPGSVSDGIEAIGGPIGLLCGYEEYPRTASYWDTLVGQTQTLGWFDRLRIANCGAADLNVTDVVLSGPYADDFVLGPTTCVGTYPPTTDPWGQSCFVDLVFAPKTAGAKEATVTVYSDGVNAPQVLTIAGTAKPVSDEAITVTASPDPVYVGDVLTYTVTVANAGPSDDPGPTVGFYAPYSGSLVSSPEGATCEPLYTGTGWACALHAAPVAAGASATYEYQLIPDAAGILEASFLVIAGATDLGYGNNSASVYTTAEDVDTTPPVLTLPDWINADALSHAGTPVEYSTSAEDARDGPVPVTCTPESGSTFPLGVTDVHCTASDTAGNMAEGDFTVYVRLLVTKTTKLTQDFNTTLVIGADGITLDCAGRTITGPGDPELDISGILLEGRTGVTVKRCRVTGFGNGIQVADSSGVTLSGNTAVGNGTNGFGLSNADTIVLKLNTATENGGSGVFVTESTGVVVKGNTANENGWTGIHAQWSPGAVITGNDAHRNAHVGIEVQFSDHTTMAGNTASGNAIGLALYNADDGNVARGNTASDSLDSGFIVTDSDGNVLSGNTARDNTSTGLVVRDSTGNTIEGNTAEGNALAGIALLGGSTDNRFEDNTASRNGAEGFLFVGVSGNTLTNNTANQNGSAGIDLRDGSNQNVLTGNTANLNADGIRVFTDSNGNILTGNVANENGSFGFPVFDNASGNVLTGNTANRNLSCGMAAMWGASGNVFRDNTALNTIDGMDIWDEVPDLNTWENNTYRTICAGPGC